VLALLSDIHANIAALEACLAHADAHGAKRYAFLGDLVGYNADVREVVQRVADYAEQGAIVLKGNHDEAVETSSAYLNDASRAAIDWARSQLSAEERRFLAELPLVHREDDLCLVHATVDHPERWHYLDSPAAAHRSMEAAACPYTFVGHVHEQRLYTEQQGRAHAFHPSPGTAIPVLRNRRRLAIVGTVGQPRDNNQAAGYCLFDAAQARVTFFRIPYDYRATAARIRAAGLPEALAYRIERGF